MRLLVSIGHPAHVHVFKNLIRLLEKRGHEIKIVARDKDVALDLLDNYGFNYELLSSRKYGMVGLGIEVLQRHYRFFRVMRKFKPDIAIALFGPSIVQVGRLLGVPTIVLADNRPTMTKFLPMNLLVSPFATVILTLTSVIYDFGLKGVKMNGYKELAYLHPNYFKPDSSVLDSVGISREDKFIIFRFVEWNVSHGHYGFSSKVKRKLISEIEKYGRVLITSESALPSEYEKYRMTLPPERMHDLLYYATLLVGDSQTMTTEAAILGTPAIRCNSFAGPNDMGNFIELERKYDLIYSFREPDKAIQKALELLQQPDLKEKWAKKRERLLADKIDVTQFMVDFIENYPQSFYRYKEENKSRQ